MHSRSHVTPGMPPKEREMRKQTLTTMVDNINTLEEECTHMYIETMGVLKQLNDNRVK
jgi:hypothetical protein